MGKSKRHVEFQWLVNHDGTYDDWKYEVTNGKRTLVEARIGLKSLPKNLN